MTQPFSVEAYDIDTERLRLRPWRPNDLLDFYEYASVPGVGEMAGWPHHTSLDETPASIKWNKSLSPRKSATC